jgi:hypothetical protein
MVRLRPDAGWLANVVAQLEADPDVRDRLLVQANNLAVVQGPRIVVQRRPHASAPAGRACSVRNSEAVRLAVSLARSPVRWAELVDAVAAAFPTLAPTSAEALVADLVRHGVLISVLRPPSTCDDPVQHLVDRLDAAEDRDSGRPPTVEAALRSIHGHLGVAEHETINLRTLAGQMRHLAPAAQPLAVDVRLADQVVLPDQVTIEITAAVEALRRLTPDPAGRPEWRAFHAKLDGAPTAAGHRYRTLTHDRDRCKSLDLVSKNSRAGHRLLVQRAADRVAGLTRSTADAGYCSMCPGSIARTTPRTSEIV